MSGLMTKKEKYHTYNSLICLAKSLEKRYTTIDLRNETSVTGKINEVDGYMNVMLSDAALYDCDGKYHYFPILFIQARNIRNIHIPDNIPIRKAIEEAVTLVPKAKEKSSRTFKQSRAQKQQLETLKLISEIKKQKKKSKGEDEKSD